MSHINRYWWSLLICLISAALTIVFLIFHRFLSWPYFIYIGVIFWVISVIFIFKALFFDFDYKMNNWIKAWEFSYRYFEGFGYSLASGGIVALFAPPEPTTRAISSAIGIMVVGFFFLWVAEYKKGRIANFNELVSGGGKNGN